MNAFIPRFAGVWRFFYFQKSSDPALVFQPKTVRVKYFPQTKLKDQLMKIRSLAMASLLVLSVTSALATTGCAIRTARLRTSMNETPGFH